MIHLWTSYVGLPIPLSFSPFSYAFPLHSWFLKGFSVGSRWWSFPICNYLIVLFLAFWMSLLGFGSLILLDHLCLCRFHLFGFGWIGFGWVGWLEVGSFLASLPFITNRFQTLSNIICITYTLYTSYIKNSKFIFNYL